VEYNTAAIIIDQWDDSGYLNLLPKEYVKQYVQEHVLSDPGYHLVNNIKNYIDQESKIDLIILSSYSIKSECLEKTQYNKNSLKLLSNPLYIKKFKQLSAIPVSEEKTDPRLIKWNTKKTKISMHFPWELQLFLQSNTIKDYFICGATFEGCVQDRPLGVDSLNEFINKHKLKSKIFIKQDLVLTESDLFFDPKKYPNWSKFDSDIFYYNPK
jgi:nicotinamidase-related amidase